MSAIVNQKLSDLIDQWLKQESSGIEFSIDLDIVWSIPGYADKGKAKRRITSKTSHLIENIDYKIEKGDPIKVDGKPVILGRSADKIMLSLSGFVKFLIVSQTTQATGIVFEMIEKLTGLAMGRVSSNSDASGFVYLVKQSVNSYYKIGKSRNPYARLHTLQTGTPLELIIVERYFSIDCGQLESLLHNYYQSYWVRGEWFSFPDSIAKEFLSVARMLDGQIEELFLSEHEKQDDTQTLPG